MRTLLRHPWLHRGDTCLPAETMLRYNDDYAAQSLSNQPEAEVGRGGACGASSTRALGRRPGCIIYLFYVPAESVCLYYEPCCWK